MAGASPFKADLIVHDLDGMQATGVTNQASHERTTRRRSSTMRPGLAPLKTDLGRPSALESLQDVKLTRKRAARACDQCRRRKSRCDGQMNCSACKVVGLQCSYGHTIKQARGPSYVAHLEKKVEELENRIRRTSCASESEARQSKSASHSPKAQPSTAQCSPTTSEWPCFPSAAPSVISDQFSFPGNGNIHPTAGGLEAAPTYIRTITTEPRGKPFGFDILRQLWNCCSTISSCNAESSLKLVQALDCPVPVDSVPVSSAPLLPPKAQLIRWIGIAFTEAFQLWPFVDKAQVQRVIYRLYNTNTFGQDENDRDELALLYAMLALGQRFDPAKNVSATESRVQGLQYFSAAKEIVPLPTCDRSLPALQTILCLALYLKAGNAQTRVHAYVSAAASAGLRMGLHEQVPCFPEDELAIRHRIWSTVRSLDVLVSATLGIPHIVSIDPGEESPFPALSSGLEEELVTSCAHVRLLGILSRAIDRTYCSVSVRKPLGLVPLSVADESLQMASHELETWEASCTILNTPVENMRKTQLLLSYSHAYAQLILYSPFVHHLAHPPGSSGSRENVYAFKAFKAAVKLVRVAEVLHKRMWLNEAHFTAVDGLAFAGMALLVVEQSSTVSHLLMEAIQSGKRTKELLLMLSLQNTAAAECWEALSVSWSTLKGSGSPAGVLPLSQSMVSTGPAPTSQARPKMPPLISQDSAIDVNSPVASSPMISQPDPRALLVPSVVDPVIA